MSPVTEVALVFLACGVILSVVVGSIMLVLLALDHMIRETPNTTFLQALNTSIRRLSSPSTWH